MPTRPYRAILLAVVLAACAGNAGLAEEFRANAPTPLEQLTTLRDTLRTQLDKKLQADTASAPAADLVLTLSPGLGKGPTRLTLRRQGERWFPYALTGLPDTWYLRGIDARTVALQDNRLKGALVFSYTREDLDEQSDEDAPAIQQQTFQLDVPLTTVERRLVLTLHRSIAGDDWTLIFKPEGKGWVFDRELAAAKRLSDWGPFTRDIGPLTPDANGRFTTTIKLTYTGKEPRLAEAYTTSGHPVLTFSGQIVNDRIDTTYILKAPGGKHVLNSGTDAASAAVLRATADGKFHSKGDKGEWRGTASGMLMDAPANSAALDTLAAPDNAPDPVRAAVLYHQIAALDLALRHYPMPLEEAINRTAIPQPVVTEADAGAYLAGLLTHAKTIAADRDAKALTGHRTADDPAFGPFYESRKLDNAVPPVGAGPQDWRWVANWYMIGPFPLIDHDADVRAPEVLPLPAAAYARTRTFADAKGEIEDRTDNAQWSSAAIDRGMVTAPPKPEHSAAAQRYFAWYATAEINSDANQTVHAAISLQGQALIWVNDTLVWRSGADYDALQPTILQIPLKQGPNRILVRCASSRASNAHYSRIDWFDGYDFRPQGRIDMTGFALHLCMQGKPQGTALPGTAAPAPADAPTGYRRDGTGAYPDAKPPLAWDLSTGANVAWKTPLAKGTADPVVRDGKVFVTAEPNTLAAIDLATGKVLWQKEVAHPDATLPPKAKFTASATPVATATHVYATFGNGTAAAFTHDGTQRWVAPTGMPWSEPNMGSPLLVDDTLIIQGHLPAKGDRKEARPWSLIGLDAATGKPKWTATGEPKRVITPHDRAVGLGNGIALMRLANGDARRNVVITGDGAVIDAATGALLHRDIFTREASRAAPVVSGDVVYNTPVTGEEAVRLWLTADGKVGAKTLWANPPAWGRGQTKTVTAFGSQHWLKGPVVDGDLLYVWRVDKSHVPQHHPVPAGQLDIFDTRSGARVARLRNLTHAGTDPTIPPTIAGKYIFLGDGGDPVPGFHGTTDYGQLNVAELLRLPPDQRAATGTFTATIQGAMGTAILAAKNRTTAMRASPVFVDDRLLLRTYDALVCIRAADAAGQKLEAQRLAAATYDDFLGPKPKPGNVLTIAPVATPVTDDTPASALAPGRVPATWTAFGPLPLDTQADDLLKPFAGGDAWPAAGGTVTVGATAFTLTALDDAARTPNGDINAFVATGNKQNLAGGFFTVLESNRKQTLVFEPRGAAATYYLAGRELKSGDTLILQIGSYPLVAKVNIARLPPFVKTLGFAPLFHPPQPNTLSYAQWRDRIALIQPRLERIIKELPNTGEAKRAAALQKELTKPPAP